MPNLKFSGPLSLRLRSLSTLNRIAMTTYIRHAFGRRIAPDWDANMEIGIRFVRHQFTVAMTGPDLARGRLLFDSVQAETDDVYDVTTQACTSPKGTWYSPTTKKSDAVLLYLHGGGYTFHGAVSARFAAMLAHHVGAVLFAPDYRLTPEHPHPAQSEDALAAWSHVTDGVSPDKIVVIGDSAGGHMSLMLMQNLKAKGMAQPALCVGLCPWTDIDNDSPSMRDNDQYDLVQGWMAQKFGEWLDPKGVHGREALSPVFQDYSGMAPLYLQAGGREVLRDMIVEFAETQKAKGADVMLDLWQDMPHDFQAYDTLKESSSLALSRLTGAIHSHVDQKEALPALAGVTVI